MLVVVRARRPNREPGANQKRPIAQEDIARTHGGLKVRWDREALCVMQDVRGDGALLSCPFRDKCHDGRLPA
jgi:hypothetical protein